MSTAQAEQTTGAVRRYSVFVHYSAEDECFYAEVPTLGIVTDADTEEDAFAMAEEAISLWVQVALEDGEELPLENPPASLRQIAV